jgi:hypothetical protein
LGVHEENTGETRILTVGEIVPWDNSGEREEENWGTLIYDNRQQSVGGEIERLACAVSHFASGVTSQSPTVWWGG